MSQAQLGSVESSRYSPKALQHKSTSMFKALSFFFNLLVLVIVLKIFAPGLAGELITLATNIVALANEAVASIAHDAQQSTYEGGL